MGETWTDDFGVSRHYSDDQGYIGSSYDGFFGRTTHIDDMPNTLFSSQADSSFEDDVFDDSSIDDSFGSSDW